MKTVASADIVGYTGFAITVLLSLGYWSAGQHCLFLALLRDRGVRHVIHASLKTLSKTCADPTFSNEATGQEAAPFERAVRTGAPRSGGGIRRVELS
jgi:hypothetical protein